MGYQGIDYGLGRTNIDKSNGIRYGVISQHSVMPEALDDVESDYGEPSCPECGGEVLPSDSKDLPEESEDWDNYQYYGCNDYACVDCKHFLDSQDVYPEEAIGQYYDHDGYQITDCLDTDLMVIKSPYYTFAQFCSPCVPGAGNLDGFMNDGVKTYCLGHDWFGGGIAPYPVYRVKDDVRIIADYAR